MSLTRFDSIAKSITERVDNPSESGCDRYVGLEHLDPDDIHLHRWGSPLDVGSTKLRFRAGDVIYGRRRAYQRKAVLVDFDGIASAHSLILRAVDGVCLPEFLAYFLQAPIFSAKAIQISVGSLSPTINWGDLCKQEFDLPSIGESRRIVELLRAVDAEIEAAALCEQRAQSALFALGDDLVSRTSEAGSVSLGGLIRIRDRERIPVSAAERERRLGPIPYFGATGRVGAIDDSIFNEELLLVGEDGVDFFSRDTHKCYRINGPSWVNNHAHVLSLPNGEDVSLLDFLEIYLNCISYRKFVNGSTRTKLTRGALESIRVPKLTPEERERVVTQAQLLKKTLNIETSSHARGLRSALLTELIG